MSRAYRMDGSPYPDTDEGLMEWAKDFEDTSRRIVKQEMLWNGIFLSTVHLGLNHNFMGFLGGPPIIFETMAFNNIGEASYEFMGRWISSHEDLFMARYSTIYEAGDGHRNARNELSSLWWTIKWWSSVVWSEYRASG